MQIKNPNLLPSHRRLCDPSFDQSVLPLLSSGILAVAPVIYNGVDQYHDTGFSAHPASGSMQVDIIRGADETCYFAGIATANRLTLGMNAFRPSFSLGGNTNSIGTTVIGVDEEATILLVWNAGLVSLFLNGVQETISSGTGTYTGAPGTDISSFIGGRNNAGNLNNPTDSTIKRVVWKDATDATLYDTNVDGFGTPYGF
eukprot:GHVN01070117.1.p1 GENE.GHVN01070117.1~~GHVN01070117.1.p1  ORF type:complete len:200 (+),score=8.44 GHVN01070117.1:725-1324(+)